MKQVHLLTFHWGWLSPACWQLVRHEQGAGYLAYLSTLPAEHFGRASFTHAGWMFDLDMPSSVRQLPDQALEPTLHIAPFDDDEVAAWRREVTDGRLEPVTYYYTPLVAEQMTGEMLLRAIRYSREVIERQLGPSPVALAGHDPFTMMQWGTEQQVQLAALTGHTVLMCGMEANVVGLDGTRLPCIGMVSMRHGLESMASPMIKQLESDQRDAFFFATEMHWHHHTNPFERALRQIRLRYGEVQFVPRAVSDWVELVRDWPDVPATGIGSKGWNAGGPDQMQLERLVRTCELLLPGIEAIAALHAGNAARNYDLRVLWKRCLVLADNQVRWLLHDQKRIYLPSGRALLEDVIETAQSVLSQASTPLRGKAPRAIVWNLLGWERSGVAEATVKLPDGCQSIILQGPQGEIPVVQKTPVPGDPQQVRISWQAESLPAWGYKAYDLLPAESRVDQPDGDAGDLTLENDRLRAEFASNGELLSLQDKRSGRSLDGGHRLLNVLAEPVEDEVRQIVARKPLAEQGWDGAGCCQVWAEVVVPEVAHYNLDLEEVFGCLILVEVVLSLAIGGGQRDAGRGFGAGSCAPAPALPGNAASMRIRYCCDLTRRIRPY